MLNKYLCILYLCKYFSNINMAAPKTSTCDSCRWRAFLCSGNIYFFKEMKPCFRKKLFCFKANIHSQLGS